MTVYMNVKYLKQWSVPLCTKIITVLFLYSALYNFDCIFIMDISPTKAHYVYMFKVNNSIEGHRSKRDKYVLPKFKLTILHSILI